jgi:hypothetical protein
MIAMSRDTRNRLAIAAFIASCGASWVLFASGGGSAPPRWTGLVDVSGTCYYAVPADWKIDASSELANVISWSADGRAKSIVAWSSHGWAPLIDGLRSTLHAVAVHEDSAQRFWIEYASAPGAHHVAAIPARGGGCLLYVDVDEKAERPLHLVATEIVRTLTALR